MVNFTQEQKNVLMEQAQSFLQQSQEGKNAREIMAQIYVDGLDNKTLDQGFVMADAILESVNAFDSDYAQAKDDLDRWLDKMLKELVVDKTAAQRCTLWLRMAATVNGITAQNHHGISEEEKRKILDQVNTLSIEEEEATVEMESQLYQEAKQALKNSGVMVSALISQQDALQELMEIEDEATVLLELGSREIDFRAIASMIAYVNVKNGTFDNVPVDMRLDQITTMVCAGLEQIRILDAVSKGKLPLEVAAMLLKILGLVCAVKLCVGMSIMTVGVVSAMELGILMLPASMLMSLSIGYILCQGLNQWYQVSDRLVTWAEVPVQKMADAVQNVIHYTRENIVPNLVAMVASAWQWLKDFIGSRKTTVEETQTQAERLALPEGE